MIGKDQRHKTASPVSLSAVYYIPHFVFFKYKGYLYLFKDKLRYGWQKKEYRSIYSYEQYWRRTC